MKSDFPYLMNVDEFVRQVDCVATSLIDVSTQLFTVRTASDIPSQLEIFKEALTQKPPKSVNGIYIWRVRCTPATVLSVWRRRVSLYREYDKKNRSDRSLQITSIPRKGNEPSLLNFFLPEPNPRWLNLHEGQGTEAGEYVLYVGKRTGGAVFTRLAQHYSCGPGTGAMKLGGTSMPVLELSTVQKRFLRNFVERDKRLVESLAVDELKCNVIFLGGQDEHITPVIEGMLRSVLVPILGEK